jgi:TRAP-type C4-dicarboxylate transport system substrate-binding protein
MDKHLMGEYKLTRPLAVFVTPPAVFMMRKKPVRSLADLKGLKIRVASKSAATIIEAYGATPVQMPANKVYTSMSTGVVDGALMGSDSLLIFKLIEPTKYVTIGLPEMPTTIFLVMNEKAYNELSSSEKSALDSLTGLGMSIRAANGLAGFGKIALKKFSGISGKEIIELSAAERAKFDSAAAQGVKNVIRDQKSKGIPADQIVAAMKN